MAVDDSQLLRDIEALGALEDVTLTLSRPDCLILLTLLQFALKHPELTGSGAEVARKLGRMLELEVAITPTLSATISSGW